MSVLIKNKNVLFTFYHIEKCAGTSLRYELYNYFSRFIDRELIFIPEVNKLGKNVNLTNNALLQIAKLGKEYIEYINNKLIILCHISFNDPIFDYRPKFKLISIRNPITRAISHYNYFDKKKYNKEFDQLNDDEFNEWFSKSGNLTIFRLTNTYNNLELAKKNLLLMDHVILFENYNNDVKQLGKKLEKKFGYKFYHIKLKKNRSREKFYYDSKFIDKLIYRLKDEIELYNFYKKSKNSIKNI